MALDILKSIKVDSEVVDVCNNCWPSNTDFEFVILAIADGEPAAQVMTLDVTVDNLTTGAEIFTTQLTGLTDGITGDKTLQFPVIPGTLISFPTPGRYRLELTTTVATSSNTLTEYIHLLICPNIQWTKDSCKNYTITTDDTNVTSFGVHSADGVLIETITLVDGSGSFTLPSEGVYLIRMSDGITYSLYEFCDLQECLKKLIREILCPDLDDPCCNNCREEDVAERERLRKELNKLIAMYGMYLGGKMDETTRYLGVFDFINDSDGDGIFDIDACQSAILQNMDNMISDIKEVTRRCGDGCDDTVTSSPCTSC